MYNVARAEVDDMDPPPIRHRFLTGPYLLAIIAALMWIVSAWLPLGYWEDGRWITLIEDYILFDMKGSGVIASGHYVVAVGFVTVVVIMFSLRNAVYWSVILLACRWYASRENQSWMPVKAWIAFELMLFSIIILFAASVWARKKEGKRRASSREKEAAEP